MCQAGVPYLLDHHRIVRLLDTQPDGTGQGSHQGPEPLWVHVDMTGLPSSPDLDPRSGLSFLHMSERKPGLCGLGLPGYSQEGLTGIL